MNMKLQRIASALLCSLLLSAPTFADDKFAAETAKEIEAGHWVIERRDVREDFRAAFGELAGRLKSIALASDTDNTGETAHAGFADFRFVANESDCQE